MAGAGTDLKAFSRSSWANDCIKISEIGRRMGYGNEDVRLFTFIYTRVTEEGSYESFGEDRASEIRELAKKMGVTDEGLLCRLTSGDRNAAANALIEAHGKAKDAMGGGADELASYINLYIDDGFLREKMRIYMEEILPAVDGYDLGDNHV